MNLLSKLEKKKETWFLLFIIFIFVILRIPSLFEPYWYGDEGIYQAIGIALREGRMLYSEIWDNKPPLIYLVYAVFNGDQFMLRLLSIIVGILTIIVFFFLARILLEKRFQTFLSTTIFALLLSLPLLEANIANGEIFIMLPVLLAAFFIFKTTKIAEGEKIKIPFLNKKVKKLNLKLAISGLLLSIAFLFKIVAIFDLLAFAIFILFIHLKYQRGEIKSKLDIVLKKEAIIFVSFLVPIILTTLFFLFHGVIIDFYVSVLGDMIGYVGYGNQFIIPQGFLIFKLLVLALIVYVIFLKRKSYSNATIFILLWFAFSMFSAFFSQRPYNHYLLVLIASWALLFGLILKKEKGQILALIIFLIGTFYITYNFSFYRKNLSYYKNFIDFVTAKKSLMEYQMFFDPITHRDYVVSQFLINNTNKEDNIFMWGNSAQIYKMTNKLPPGRFTVAYHINTNEFKDETKTAVSEQKPKFIVIMPDQEPIPSSLKNYRLLLFLEKAAIYERVL